MFKNPQIAEVKYQYNVIYFTKAFWLPVMVEKESCNILCQTRMLQDIESSSNVLHC